jgi:HEAT repeat protein
MGTEKIKKKDEAMLAGLFSTKADEVLAALNDIHERGNVNMIEPLLKTIIDWPGDAAIERKAKTILGELKTEAAIEVLIQALDNDVYVSQKAFILSIFWHAGLYPVDHVDTLVRHAIKGDFYVALESLTILENMDSEIDPDVLQHALIDIDEFLDQHPDAEHNGIIKSLKQLLTEKQNQ